MKLLRANKNMTRRYASCLMITDTALPRHFSSILKSELIKKDDCVFVKSLLAQCDAVSSNNFPDKTGYECFVNHIHIDGIELEKALKIGVAFLNQISIIIRKFGIHGAIRGIVSANDTDVTVSFHLLRPDEAWLSDNIEGYKEECVAEFEL